MSALTAHIQELNAKTKAWIDEDPDNRWAGMLVEEADHWAEYGVYTVEQFERHMLIETIWDVYKEVNGCRPRGLNFDEMSMEELQSFLDRL